MRPNARVQMLQNHLSSEDSLTAEDLASWEENGFLVLRGLLSADEITRLKHPIKSAYQNHAYEASAAYDIPDNGVSNSEGRERRYQYPSPGNFPLGSRILDVSPEVLPLSAGNPAIVRAVEQLLGDEAVLSQFQIYCRTPGSKGTGDSSEQNAGKGTHYDYKPWRPVGSFLDWLFAIVPLVDYTDEAGPLLVAPGSHSLTKVKLHNAELKAGDVLLMHGWCWHEAWPNNSADDRVGVYLKYHALHAPPATGPILHPTRAVLQLQEDMRHVVRYHRSDGRYSAIDSWAGDGAVDSGSTRAGALSSSISGRASMSAPRPSVDQVRLLLEDATGRVLFARDAWGRHWLPGRAADEWGQYTAAQLVALQYLDCGNLIGCATQYARDVLQVEVPWCSWVADLTTNVSGTQQHLSRVYAHRFQADFTDLSTADSVKCHPSFFDGAGADVGRVAEECELVWLTQDETSALPPRELGQGFEFVWMQMWQQGVADDGRPVRRGIGLDHSRYNRLLAGTFNNAGNSSQASVRARPSPRSQVDIGWTFGEFDSSGSLALPPEKHSDWAQS